MKKEILSLLCVLGLASGCVFGADDSSMMDAQRPNRTMLGTTLRDIDIMNPVQERRFIEDLGRYVDGYQYFSSIASTPKSGLNEKTLKAVNMAERIKARQKLANRLSALVEKLKGVEGLREFGQRLGDRIAQNKSDMESIAKNDIMEAQKGNGKSLWKDMRRYGKDLKSFRKEANRAILRAIHKKLNMTETQESAAGDDASTDDIDQE